MELEDQESKAEPNLAGPTPQTAGGERDQRSKTPSLSFRSWIARQSFPRLLGLLVGNTRELEQALARAESEAIYFQWEAASLRKETQKEIEWWRTRYQELSDSVLLSKGILPTSAEARNAVTGQSQFVQTGEPRISPKQLELEAEADKLIEMLQRGDVFALQEKIEDMLASGRPNDKRILQLYAKREQELSGFERDAEIGMGVIIGVPEAASVS